jgi:hypothetical protein
MLQRTALLTATIACSLIAIAVGDKKPIDPRPLPQPTIQIALLLDTSNSMDGLINQARTQLWKIVNEFNACKQNGVAPKLQVALYEYGNNNLAAGEGYIRMVLPLTTDLDLVSEKLWALKTNGGSEYCGHVIKNAVSELDWSRDHRIYRAIFIAGNEPFTQGNVDYRSSCAEALNKGIVINTIHCGAENVGREGKWDDGARVGEGKFLNIDQDRASVVIDTPHDKDLIRLSAELNKTYVAYGAAGGQGQMRQQAMDQVATTQPSVAAERAVAKSNSSYSNAGWDLVDAKRERKLGDEELARMDAKDLPAEMREMSPEKRVAYIEEQAKNRESIQKQIAELNAKRAAYIEAEQKKANPAAPDTLDTAVLKAVREQLEAKGYKRE